MATIEVETESESFVEEISVCGICHKEASKYTCPRCNTRYCSTECYKSTGHAECSEAFYKDCFMEGLKDFKPSSEDKTKKMDILEKIGKENEEVNSDDEADEDDGSDLHDRMDGLNLDEDSEKIWNQLTDKEKMEFDRMVRDGRLGNMLELWQPWWQEKDLALVEEIGTKKKALSHPVVRKDVPDLAVMLKNSKPSDLLLYTLVNCLYGYAYICRLTNGEHQQMIPQSAQDILNISEGFSSRNFQSTSESISGCLLDLRAKAKTTFVSEEFSTAVIQDVKMILHGPHQRVSPLYARAALSDLSTLFKKSKKSLDKDLKAAPDGSSELEEIKKQKHRLYSALKKVEFLLSWTAKQRDSLCSVITDLELEFCTLSTDLSSQKKNEKILETKWKGKLPKKKIIEEI